MDIRNTRKAILALRNYIADLKICKFHDGGWLPDDTDESVVTRHIKRMFARTHEDFEPNEHDQLTQRSKETIILDRIDALLNTPDYINIRDLVWSTRLPMIKNSNPEISSKIQNLMCEIAQFEDEVDGTKNGSTIIYQKYITHGTSNGSADTNPDGVFAV